MRISLFLVLVLVTSAGVLLLGAGCGKSTSDSKDRPQDKPGVPPVEEPKDEPLTGAAGPRIMKFGDVPGVSDISLEETVEFLPPRIRDAMKRNMELAKQGKPPEQNEGWPLVYPSGTKELYVRVLFSDQPPPSTKVDVRLRTDPDQKENVSIGPPIVERRGLSEKVAVLMSFPCQGKMGSLPRGVYQAVVTINDTRRAVLNWAVGPDKP